MKIIDCQVNHKTNPLGYLMDYPVFSYLIVESEGKKQAAARIKISLDEKFETVVEDTGWSTDINPLGHAIPLNLQPCTRYFWTVTIKSDVNEIATSRTNWFETGKQNQVWTGKWITCSQKTGRHPIFSKTFVTNKSIKSARLYICGLGLYEAYMNGVKVGREYLAPYCNNYSEWLQYQSFDITNSLSKENKIEVLLGNGWFKGRFGFDESEGINHYGDAWELVSEIHIQYADDTVERISTDESWNVRYGNILESSIYDGEVVDSTLTDTETSSCLLSSRRTDLLTERLSTPVLIQEELKPVELIQTPLGEIVLDLGQNHTGIFKLKVNEKKGTVIKLQFGEILQGGNFYRENLRTAKAQYTYISNGDPVEISPKFTFYGYRYVKVEGIEFLEKNDFTSYVLHSQLPKIGFIETGNTKVNKLIENVEWGLKSNFIDVPTDCPQRDERMGWTGDAQVFSQTALYLRNCYSFYEKYLYDLSKEQLSAFGRVPNYVPSFGDEGTSSVWGDAACIIPWNVYLFSGDKEILKSQYPSMLAWVDYIRKIYNDHNEWDSVYHFGDWLALDTHANGKNEVRGATPIDFITRVYYYNSVRITAKTAQLLSKNKDAKRLKELEDELLHHIQNEYFTNNGRSVVQTQTGLLMSLNFDLIENKEKIISRLKEKFEETDHKLETGFVGTSMLCTVLSQFGMEDLAYELLFNEEFPGWLYAVNLGATTIWERWNSVQEDGTISDSGMNSLNHYSYGSIVEWIFKYCMGISPLENHPGFTKVRIAPQLNWKMRKLDATYNSVAGAYHVRWELINGEHVELKVTVPFNCEAILDLPNFAEGEYLKCDNTSIKEIKEGQYILEPGKYMLSYKTNKNFKKIWSTYTPIKELLYHSEIKKILTKYSPTILDVPKEMRHQSIRDISSKYVGNDDNLRQQLDEQFTQMDQLLATIE